MKTRKCQWCKEHGNMEEMVVELTNGVKPVKKFYHKDCHEKFLKDKEFKEKERVELDKLVEVIKKIYGAKVIPNSVYPYLQDLRNGTKFFGKYDHKYKQGYSYDLIAETFEYCSETIEYWNTRKSFNGFSNALRYGLVIVCDKLSLVENRRKQREKNAIAMQKHIEDIKEEEQEFQESYKKKEKAKTDISDFLDE